jgi:hypothetical protein
MTHPATYLTDPTTRQLLLMTRDPTLDRWLPDLTAMSAYRAGTLNAYRPAGPGTTLYTIADIGAPILRWQPLAHDDPDILATVPLHSWIEPGTIITEVATADILRMDTWLRSAADTPMLAPPEPPPEAFSTDAATRLGALLTAATEFRPLPVHQGHEWPRGPTLVYSPTDRLELLWRIAATDPEPTPEPSAPPPAQHIPPQIPPHIAAIVLRQAVTDATVCPITMEPITTTNGAVTSCGHVFVAHALREWIAAHGTCPTCRSPAGPPSVPSR